MIQEPKQASGELTKAIIWCGYFILPLIIATSLMFIWYHLINSMYDNTVLCTEEHTYVWRD